MSTVAEHSANSPITGDMNVGLPHYTGSFPQGWDCIFVTPIPGTPQDAWDSRARGAWTGFPASLPRFLLVARENRIWGKENCAIGNILRGFTPRTF